MNTCDTNRPSYFIVDWPSQGREVYDVYLSALHRAGFGIDIEEMMDWGCMAIQQIGGHSPMLEKVAHRIYFSAEDLLPRGHDQKVVMDLIVEVLEVLYGSMYEEYGDLFQGYRRRVWVKEVSDTGILMEVDNG